MKHDDAADSDEIYALLGRVVAQILQPGEALPLQEIIGALYRTGQRSGDPAIQAACERAMRLLASKLH
ncbi:hypothetical protein BBB56_16000 [Candidatus Pantoea deserta]|uniref:Uncharacterized protein n=1 Tax=Candidatus Pantoea deserta TaxID=1869313 RepID=A0A3N4NUR8_9GAMM|nr:hypothetical protein [Pantoea deserta]RPD98068.1 hypothetical protein BBB56_16000 [Pantoea deserta]